ncbi:MAG: C-terminal target protein [Bacteroidetes bacterium]|nr:C-terminal target protein [Bacteroidota bacterium]
MKKAFLILILICVARCSYAQHTVARKWDATFGGDSMDFLYAICEAKGGGYFLGGISYSGIEGNKTQASRGGADYWVVKVSADGHYLWDKAYGGGGSDYFTDVCATRDGGCLIGGGSSSGVTGDKTQPRWGGFDVWIVKLDSMGNKQWDRRFGGTADDFLSRVKQTPDGGYIMGCTSGSGMNGDKSDSSRGSDDFWIIKIDSAGNKLWDKRFGSQWNDADNDIILTPDGGYLLGGTSYSPNIGISGDKTEPNFGPMTNNFWIIKTDSLCNKQWDKVYGGEFGENFSNSLVASDGNYLLGGESFDSISGDKTDPDCGYWVVKIDPLGNKLGDWAYGTGRDCQQTFSRMANTSDGGYVLTGNSGPVTGYDKTENNLGRVQAWTIKIDSQMHRVWDKTSLTNGSDDQPFAVLQNSAGCYVIGVQTYANIDGEKTSVAGPNSGWDYWVVEYCDTVLTSITETAGDVRFSIYPNPTEREVSIHLEQANLKEAAFTLTNTQGQLIYQSDETNLASSYTKILDLGTLPTGIYLLDITTSGQHIVRKILKE